MDLNNSFEDLEYKDKQNSCMIVDLSNIELQQQLIGQNILKLSDENKALIEDSDDENDIRQVDIQRAVGALTLLRKDEELALKKLQEVRIEILQQKKYILDLKNRRFIQQVERQNFLMADEDIETGGYAFKEIIIKKVSQFDYDIESILQSRQSCKVLTEPRTNKIERYTEYKKWFKQQKDKHVGVNWGLQDSLLEVLAYYIGQEPLHERQYNQIYHILRRKISIQLGFDVTSIYPNRQAIEKECEARYVMKINEFDSYKTKQQFEQSAVMMDAFLSDFIVTMHLTLDLKSKQFMFRGPNEFQRKNQQDQGFNFWELVAVQKQKDNRMPALFSNAGHLSQIYKSHIENESADIHREYQKNARVGGYASEYFNVQFCFIQRVLFFSNQKIAFQLSFKLRLEDGQFYYLDNEGKKTLILNLPPEVDKMQEEVQQTWYPFFAKYNNGEDYGGSIDVSHTVFDTFMSKYDINTNLNRKSYAI